MTEVDVRIAKLGVEAPTETPTHSGETCAKSGTEKKEVSTQLGIGNSKALKNNQPKNSGLFRIAPKVLERRKGERRYKTILIDDANFIHRPAGDRLATPTQANSLQALTKP